MSSWRLQARRPVGSSEALRVVRDPDVLAAHLEDAAHFPGGHARALIVPANEAEVAEALRRSTSVIPIGAQSSLTGGATPMGEVLLSTARLNRVFSISETHVRVQAGVPLRVLDQALAAAGRYFPPTPTFDGAFVGGIVATNAAGAATFKYGATRSWVDGLTVVLADGSVLDIERGATIAHPDGYFELDLLDRLVRVPVSLYRLPQVSKLSAGYHAAPRMDLIDLFVGSEGTLGIVTEVLLRVVSPRPARCLVFVPFAHLAKALAFVRRLRDEATTTRRSKNIRGLDVSAIEHMDGRCLTLIREDRIDRDSGVRVPASAAMALLVAIDLPSGTTSEQAFDELGLAESPEAHDTPLVRLTRLLADYDLLESIEIAVPGDDVRAAQLLAVREAVPAGVNQRVGQLQQRVDSRIQKVAADIIVPVERLEEMFEVCGTEARRRNLDLAVWGHISDGNLHPNVIPRTIDEMTAGVEAVLEFGRAAIRLGGAPMAEHGVGRNPVKQRLLREMLGESGIREMQEVKRAIDPVWKLSPGVIFPRSE
jgi:D-lactate dehydrogenase (cytochrome)